MISNNENKSDSQPEDDPEPIKLMNGIEQGNPEEKNKNRKALTDTDLLHKKN
jgi:hypothetical protein